MTRFLRYALTIGGALMSILLFLLTTASENSAALSQYFGWLLAANICVALALLLLVLALLGRLLGRYRRREFGSRLMTRLVLLFALVGIVPGSVIYLVSVQFVSRSIESWFDVKVEAALESGLNLGHSALEYSLAELQAKARDMAAQLSEPSEAALAIHLSRLREQMQVQEATLVNGRGRLVATANAMVGSLLPELPSAAMLRQARTGHGFAVTEGHGEEGADSKSGGNGLRSRVVVPLPAGTGMSLQNEALYLQLLQPVPGALANQAEALQTVWGEYQVRSLGRASLKTMYILTLSLTLLLAIFAAITSAFWIAGRLARPLLLLAEGTQAVAEGNLSPRPIVASNDELGNLTQSFNTMTRQLFDARAAVEKNRAELENAKAYLESVLANMSAGVMVLDPAFRLVTCNESVERILHQRMEHEVGRPLADIPGMRAFAEAVAEAFSEQHAQHAAADGAHRHWQKQIEVPRLASSEAAASPAAADPVEEAAGLTLLARGSHLPVGSGEGALIVFDDITSLISAQRSIAWGEVARRLAHEIKNPLTPIQLSAERLQMKLEDRLPEDLALVLKKATHTIVNQVSSMKRMVDDFRDYAKTPPAVLQPLDLAALIDDVLHLYLAGDGRDIIRLHCAADLPRIMGDATQMRQVIHNLLQNAQDAVADRPLSDTPARIDVTAETVHYSGADHSQQQAVRLSIVDNGPGFSSKILARAFEPYATSKPRGTGLGLPMVKKIVEEHGGRIDIKNRNDANGAKVSILLLKLAADSRQA